MKAKDRGGRISPWQNGQEENINETKSQFTLNVVDYKNAYKLFTSLQSLPCNVTLQLFLTRDGVHVPTPWIWVVYLTGLSQRDINSKMRYRQRFGKGLHIEPYHLLHLEPWDHHVDETELIYWGGYMEENWSTLGNNLSITKQMRAIFPDYPTYQLTTRCMSKYSRDHFRSEIILNQCRIESSIK